MDFICCSEPISSAVFEEDCTSGLVIELIDISDKVGIDVVLLLGCPQSCMPNPVEGLLEFYEDMVRRGFAGAEDISYKGFSCWRSAL